MEIKESIAPVYDFIVGLFNVIDLTIKSIVESISQIIGSGFNTLSQLTDSVFGQTDFTVGDSGNAAKSIVEALAKFIPSLFNWIAAFAVEFNSITQQFLVGLEYVFTRANPYTTTNRENTDARIEGIKLEAALRQKILKKNLEETTKGITKSFNESSAKAIEDSKLEREKSLANAEYVRQQLAQKQIEQQKEQGNFDQGITPGNIQEIPAVKAMLQIVDALVGSVQSTRGNVLRKGKPIDEKQLEEQQKQTVLLQKIAENDGILLPP